MLWTFAAEFQTVGRKENFGQAVQLVIQKPQVLSKAYAGAQVIYEKDQMLNASEDICFVNSIRSFVCPWLRKNSVKWESLIDSSCDYLEKCLEEFHKDYTQASSNTPLCKTTLILQYIIPKDLQHSKAIQCYMIDDKNLTCIPLLVKNDHSFSVSKELVYKISFSSSENESMLKLYVHGEVSIVPTSWLYAAFDKFRNYCDKELDEITNQTLQLVNFDKYNDLYNKMKNKYGKFLISNWCESTDPQKFVYEDIAIAAYLILIFEEEQQKLGLDKTQTFLDIGCGNGLLVYLLTSEGYQGTGLDIRKRKIWDFFDKKLDLKEDTIIPSDETLFPQYDWLIGNHSDEMTPWILVISSRSSYQGRFFVLPCCPHDFNGKFRERKSKSSSYQSYLDYVEQLTSICGFIPERDMLKIPSTKRTCIIGRRRNYEESEGSIVHTRLKEFIQGRCERLLKSNNSAGCSDDLGFVPRQEERVRNCTQVDRDLKTRIVHTVFNSLLETMNPMDINGKPWNKGGSIPLSDVAKEFDKDTLKQLSNECGGLQTLLKNQHQVFIIVRGRVQLRCGNDIDDRSASKKTSGKGANYYKTSLCFFHENHPDGCWQLSENCNYAHGVIDMKEFVGESSR